VSKELEKELKELDHVEMREKSYQLELKENYGKDEKYDELEN